MSAMDDTTSSPFTSPAPVANTNKRRRTESPVQPSSSPHVPEQTPGVSNTDVSTITKRATNFKDLMHVVLDMITWGVENPEFTDEELGHQIVKVFREVNVLP
jgi:hypothetical protein